MYILPALSIPTNGVEKDLTILSNIAKNYSMTVLMANCIGLTGEYNCAGKSSVWNNEGLLVGQMDDKNEGILVFNTESGILTEKLL